MLLALTTVVDPTLIASWPAAAVAIVLIICVLALPSYLTYKGNERVKNIETSISTNNGGSSVKDALDRIESRQVGAEQRLDSLEASVSALQKKSVRQRLKQKIGA